MQSNKSSQARLSTKRAIREPQVPRLSHGPESLRKFMLPEVQIDGQNLEEALRTLMAVYQDTCRKTGETPLNLTFSIPAGDYKRLHLKLIARNVNSSIKMLATISGMKVTRVGLQYQFEAFPTGHAKGEVTLNMPSEAVSRLADFVGIPSGNGNVNTVVERLVAAGLKIDPSTRLSMEIDHQVAISTRSDADLRALSSLIETMRIDPDFRYRLSSRIIEIPAGADWKEPAGKRLSIVQEQTLMRDAARIEGINVYNLPSIITRSGVEAKVELLAESMAGEAESGSIFESSPIRREIGIRQDQLGLGHQTGFVDMQTAVAIAMNDDEAGPDFSRDTETRFTVETRADGARTLILVKSQLVDATGVFGLENIKP